MSQSRSKWWKDKLHIHVQYVCVFKNPHLVVVNIWCGYLVFFPYLVSVSGTNRAVEIPLCPSMSPSLFDKMNCFQLLPLFSGPFQAALYAKLMFSGMSGTRQVWRNYDTVPNSRLLPSLHDKMNWFQLCPLVFHRSVVSQAPCSGEICACRVTCSYGRDVTSLGLGHTTVPPCALATTTVERPWVKEVGCGDLLR